jgi:GDSL/SGNH-like Acyl-Esterase family found in Pmr5 and Cas1p
MPMTTNRVPVPVVMVIDTTGALWKRRVAAIIIILIVLLVGGVSLRLVTARGETAGGIWSSQELMTRTEKQSDTTLHVDVVETLAVGNSSSSIAIQKVGSTNNNETCVTPELVGHWIYDEHPNLTNPNCCNPRTQYPRGHEFCPYYNVSATSDSDLYPTHVVGSTTHLAWMQGEGCGPLCRGHFHETYVWKSPNLPPWDAAEFCHLLGPHRRILMLGDSTMNQAAATLMNAVQAACPTQLEFFMSDTLIKEFYGAMSRGWHWLDVARNHSIAQDGDILVLTVGAHIARKDDLYNVSEVVLQQIMAMKQERPSLIIVYKTQQPGGCTSEIANVSLSPLEAGENFVFVKKRKGNHNHYLFYDYDKAVIRRLQELEIPFLDMRMLYSRSDAHPSSKTANPNDCLHLCSPGPLDVFATLFLQLLRNNFVVSPCV